MSEIWNFSPSLTDQVKLCIAAARKDEQSIWFQEFGHLTRRQNLDLISDLEKPTETSQTIEINTENDSKHITEQICGLKDEENRDLGAENIEELVDSIETEFLSRVDFVIEECIKNSTLLPTLAVKLSTHTIERLCKHIFDKDNINKDFLTNYLKYFLPICIKRSYNSSMLDILVTASKRYPLQFKLVLEMLIKDIETPKQVLQDFVQSLNDNEHSNLLMDISEFDMTCQEFSNNVLSIYNAYKDCKKSERIQRYIQSILTQHHLICANDRHFGRFLLKFLQTQKALKIPINSDDIEKIIDSHKSPFKRPCLTLLMELKGEDDENKMISEDESD